MSTGTASKTVKRATKTVAKKVAQASTPEKVVEKVLKTVVEPVVEVVSEKKQRKKTTRREVTHESVQAAFGDLIEFIKSEIETAGKNKSTTKTRVRGTGVKTLQSINKRIRMLQGDVNRISKPKRQRKAPASSNKNSGIMREVKWSPDILAFMGKEPDTLFSRVNATKVICNYIAGARYDENGNRIQGYALKRDAEGKPVVDKNGKPVEDTSAPLTDKHGDPLACESLQDPQDRKTVVADEPLLKLFNEPRFTYTTLQKLLTKHIIKDEE